MARLRETWHLNHRENHLGVFPGAVAVEIQVGLLATDENMYSPKTEF